MWITVKCAGLFSSAVFGVGAKRTYVTMPKSSGQVERRSSVDRNEGVERLGSTDSSVRERLEGVHRLVDDVWMVANEGGIQRRGEEGRVANVRKK